MSQRVSPAFEGAAYAQAALAQVPRILTLMDRNPASPTYGCLDRSWWLDRSTDFPNALAQYAIHGLALVWANPLPDNPYYQNPMIKRWAEAGLAFLVKQAHGDGSFDEFYPNERGWSGPSGFLLYALLSAYELLQVPPDSELGWLVRQTAARCARMHLERTERGTLANHYAMAFLPVAKAWRVLGDDSLLEPLHRRFEDLLALQDPEGWFREYDGPDPGYLSATVSFLAKMEREGYRHAGLRPAVEKALNYLSYFLWPDGTFGGALGSRQTVHLYPHGFEYYSDVFPLAASLARAAREGFAKGGFVPPAIQSDRYYHYRINELLEAALAARPLKEDGLLLPFEKEPFRCFFPRSQVLAVKSKYYYAVANFRKGGVLRVYEMPSGKAVVMDSGVEVKLANETVAAANWVNPDYQIEIKDNEATVRGKLCRIPHKTFHSAGFLVFRLIVIILGVVPFLAERLKGFFRKLLTLGVRSTVIEFERRIHFLDDRIHCVDRLDFNSADVKNLWVGAELPVRYVPQSRHFQKSELDFVPLSPPPEVMKEAREKGGLYIDRVIQFPARERQVQFDFSKKSLSSGGNIPGLFRKRRGAGLLAVAVSAVILWILYSHAGLHRVLPLLSGLQTVPLLTAFGINLAFPLLAAWRWRSALRFCGVDIPYSRAVNLTFTAWPLATVTPAKLGSLILVWAFRKEGQGKSVLASLLVERIFDLPVLIGLSLLGGFWVYPAWRTGILAGVILLPLILWALFRFAGRPLLAWVQSRWAVPFLEPGQSGFRLAAARIFASSAAIWVLSMLQWQALLSALSIRTGFLDSFLRVPSALLAGMIPVAWMGMGTRDGAFLMVYAGQLPMEKILAASLLFTAIRYLVPGLLALPWTFRFIHRSGKDHLK